MSKRFTNLPLIEVAARVSFNEPLPFGLAFIGAIRDVIRLKDFTEVEDLDQMHAAPGVRYQTIPANIGVVGGVKFVSPNKGLALVVQPDLAMVQWKKSYGPDPVDYPYHEEMIESMGVILSAISEATGISPLPAHVSNMLYTKFIATEPGSASQTIGRYYNEDLWVPAMMKTDRFHEANYSWREPSGVDVRFHLRYAEAHLGEKQEQGYMVSDAAGIELNGQIDPLEGLKVVHDVLFGFFDQSLSQDARAEWGYLDG